MDGSTEEVDAKDVSTAWTIGKIKAKDKKTVLFGIEEVKEVPKEEEFEPILFPRLRRRLREKRQEWKEQRKESSSVENRDITDLVRSQFNFSCPICEDIAEKVSAKLPDRVTQTQIYEAVYKLSSKDRKAQDEAMVTLQKLGVLDAVIAEVEGGWQKLKEGETHK